MMVVLKSMRQSWRFCKNSFMLAQLIISEVVGVLLRVLQVRLDMYRKRKAYLEGMLAAESAKLDSQARFVMEIIEKKLVIGTSGFYDSLWKSVVLYVDQLCFNEKL